MELNDYNCSMNDLLKDLQRVSTYAKKIDKSVTWVYKLADDKSSDIELVVVDGIKFIKEKK
jgi:hypothetical protein